MIKKTFRKKQGKAAAQMDRFENTPQPADNVYRVMITPELAEIWLDNDTHNRTPADNVIAQYSHDMKIPGAWRETAETVSWTGKFKPDWPHIEEDAVLLNGAHRLRAAVMVQSSFPCYVAWEIPLAGQERMDRGRKRTHGTELQLRGEANATTLSALARRLFGWQVAGRRLYANDISAQFNTDTELDQMIEDNPDLRLAASFAASNKVDGLQSSLVGLGWLLFNRIDADDCEEFFRRLSKGFDLTAQSPIYHLREKLKSFGAETSKPREGYLFAHLVKAWNLFRDGTEVSVFRVRLGGARPEAYPEPK
jgi:hypothetical protein